MVKSLHRMLQKISSAAVAHDFPDLLSMDFIIAVHAADAAENMPSFMGTGHGLLLRIGKQRIALPAGLLVIHANAVDADHVFQYADLTLRLQPPHSLKRKRSSFFSTISTENHLLYTARSYDRFLLPSNPSLCCRVLRTF